MGNQVSGLSSTKGVGGNSQLSTEDSLHNLKQIKVKRIVDVAKIRRRLTSEEEKQLLTKFNKLQQNELINKYVFRMEIMGAQVPDVISERIFSIFASSISVQSQVILQKQALGHAIQQTGSSASAAISNESTIGNQGGPQIDGMSFDDLAAVYLVFKNRRVEEIAQISFEMMKLSKEQETISRDDLVHFCKRIAQLDENFVNLYYKKTQLDPRIEITREDFVDVYPLIAGISLFNMIPEMVEGFRNLHLNIELDRNSLYNKSAMGLSEIQMENYKSAAEKKLGLSNEEMASVKEYFDEEIRGKDAQSVLLVYQKLLQGIQNQELRTFLIDKITKEKGNSFEFFHELVSFTVKETNEQKKFEFLFDIFSSFKTEITRDQLALFCKIFSASVPSDAERMKKGEFVDAFKDYGLGTINIQREARLMMIVMMGLECAPREQLRAVIAFLNQGKDVIADPQNSGDQEDPLTASFVENGLDLEKYIVENLHNEESFYVVEKDFWDLWLKSCSANKFELRDESKKLIDNQKLLEREHIFRMQDSKVYKQDFVIVPKYIFKPLSKWYKCNKVIERTVHQNKIFSNIMRNQALRQSNNMRPFSPPGQLNFEMQQHGGEAIQQNKEPEQQLLKNQKSIKSIQKMVGDVMYELEIYPVCIYFQRVASDGTKPHQSCIQNNKVDFGYIKKHVPSGQLPFFEMSLTKKATLDLLLKHFAEVFNCANKKKGRLLIEDQVLSGIKLTQTLEEYGIHSGHQIWVEFLESNNTWPTDKQKASLDELQLSQQNLGYGKTVGLYNLNNTCYMNAALQCMVNIRLLHEYYVKDKLHMKQLNLDNHLGHKGVLVLSFANMMHQLWNSEQVVVPKRFKQVLGQINPQFEGDEQCDSQECVNCLLDGLHEETNLRKLKPYIENPTSDNRDMIELGLESWSNNLKRDWSFIFFLFYGQMKSTIQCLTCSKKSTTFDVFTNIPVSLPEPSQLLLNIVVHRLPNKLKYLIKKQDAPTKDQQPDANGLQNDPHLLDQKLQQNYTDLTNDQPIHICIKIDKNVTVQDLIAKILEVKDVNINPSQYVQSGCTDLVLYSKNLGTVRGIFDPINKLTQYKLITNEIYAQEVLTTKGRDHIKLVYQSTPNTQFLNQALLLGLVYSQGEAGFLNEILETKKLKKKRPASEVYPKAYLFNNHSVACDRFDYIEKLQRIPEEVYTVAYHRRFVVKHSSFFHDVQPQLLASPIILLMPSQPSGRRIYEEVWSIAHNILRRDSRYLKREQQWWNSKDWKEQMEQGRFDKGLRPFVLKTVDRQGYSCSQCNWVQKCSGCIIEPNEAEVHKDFLRKCHVAIEWHSQMIEDEYNPTQNEIMRHKSIYEHANDNSDEQIVSLESCIQKFHDVEKLSDQTFCSNCKLHQYHQISYETFRPPVILTIQFKRFKRIGNQWRKLQTLVEFPLYNLDLSSVVQDYQFLVQQDIQCQYDLCGIINHYGSLTYGHYVSVVKNPYDGQWYKYDDQFRVPIPESQIPKESAYILFYIRKDAQNKGLSEVFPSINEIFPGKPVRTKVGDGFVLGPKKDAAPKKNNRGSKEPQYQFYYVKIREDIHEIEKNDIFPDYDSNEITNNFNQVSALAQENMEDGISIKIKNGKDRSNASSLIKTIFFCSSDKGKSKEKVSDKESSQEGEKLIEKVPQASPQIQSNLLSPKNDYTPNNQASYIHLVDQSSNNNTQEISMISKKQPFNSVTPLMADASEAMEKSSNNTLKSSVKKKKKKKKKKQVMQQVEDNNDDDDM